MKLDQPYSREEFLGFVRDFLPNFRNDTRPITIPTAAKSVTQACLLGFSHELDLTVFELKITGSTERKVSQGRVGFRIMKEYQAYRALMVYYSEKDQNWRLSLMQMNPGISEVGKVVTEFSNPRRYSFLLGPDSKVKTPERRLTTRIKDFADLAERFNVEVVTKEFFAHYKKLFDKLFGYFKNDNAFKQFASKNGVELEIFTKKMLGQIVFIYFLQKKGWLGAPKGEHISKGDKTFLRSLFTKCQSNSESFFNDYLEPLFYDCLNNQPSMAGSFYRSKFECQIPFLNGGLFEPVNNYHWQKEYLHIPNDIFSNKSGDGILDIFDLYNFTVDENTPDDQEVSVDPEMLGKVFENLIEDNIRKGQGAYYTPREIVQYMCRESLINYLSSSPNINRKTVENYISFLTSDGEDTKSVGAFEGEAVEIDSLLRDIKVCDPACGSGAFLIGMLNEIIRLRLLMRALHPSKISKKSLYELKKEVIQNSLYGVDIDPGAVDIAKLRFWLSIVVDEDIDEIEPLPNLDYKIMQGNSLLENLIIGDSEIVFNFNGGNQVDKSPRIRKNLFEYDNQTKLFFDQSDTLASNLEKLHSEYFSVFDPDKKKVLKKKIDTIEDELIQSKCQEEIERIDSQIRNAPHDDKKLVSNTEKVIQIRDVLNKWKRDHLRPFFPWKLHFGEVFNSHNPGFDIIIANPPYIKEYTQKSAFDGLRTSPYYQGKMDIWYFFACMGIDLIRDRSGVMALIAQNNWVTSFGASKMRNKVINDTQILNLIDFGDYKIFDTAGIQTMVMLFQKNNAKSEYTFDFRRLSGDNLTILDVLNLLSQNGGKNKEYLQPTINRNVLINKTLTFANNQIDSVLNRIAERSNFKLDPSKEVAQGIVCPQDNVNKSSQKVLGNDFKVGDGIFILSDEELRKLKLSQKDQSLVKPLYSTDELRKWYGKQENSKWIIYTDSRFKRKENINEYEGIRAHLDQFKKVITSDNKPYGLHRSRDEYFFKGEKIISLRKCIIPTFTYTDFDSYVSATFYVIKTERINQKYLVALLNSKLMAFWLKNKGKMQGNNYQIDKEPIIELPIYVPSNVEQENISNIVSQIIELMKSYNYKSNKEKLFLVSECEKQIDKVIYRQYDLTPEDIAVVERVAR